MTREWQYQKKPASNSSTPPVQSGVLWQRPFSDPIYDRPSSPQKQDLQQKQTQPDAKRAGFDWRKMRIFPDSPEPVQAKLTVGEPGDKYEQEADSMANQVMAMPAPENESPIQREMLPEEQKEEEVQTKPLAAAITPLVQRETTPEEPIEEEVQAKALSTATIQRETTPEESKEEEVQAKALSTATIQRETAPEEPIEEDSPVQAKAESEEKSQTSGNLESQLNGSKGGGSPLPGEVRSFMEPRFGADFSGVKVHTDSNAVQMNKELGAQAFAHGSDIYYGAGKSPGKNELTAHELTHTIQQTGLVARRFTTPLEKKENKLQTKLDFSQSPVLTPKILKQENTSAPVNNKLTAHELTHLVQQTGTGKATPVNHAPIQHQIHEKEEQVQLTPTSNAIKPLLSYSILDWAVTSADESKILGLLRKDPDLSATITDLNSDGMLEALLKRVNETANRRELLQILGEKLNAKARALVEPHIKSLGEEWELQFNLGRLGVTAKAPAFDDTPFKSLISNNSSAPFTGVGATGVNPTTLSIGLIDQGLLAAGDTGTKAKYSNPIPGSLPAYLATLTQQQRCQQAELLLRRQISSVMADSYAGKIPSRAQVIRAAAKTHNLHPELVAAFILAEQRDQSKNEDAKDYFGATSLLQSNTSIGLGQVVISTAKNNDLFADLLSSDTLKGLDHDQIAKRLASDEFNILATARYIRKVADDGSKIPIANLPETQKAFPGVNMKAFAKNSSTWPDDNIRALASEYTSRAWDDNLSPGWGYFVFEAYKDVLLSGVF